MGGKLGKPKTFERLASFGQDRDVEPDFDTQNQNSIVFGKMFKMLLYGPGECGKTTILRRMLLLEGNKEEIEHQRQDYRGKIRYNLLEGAKIILDAMQMKYGLELENEELVKAAQDILYIENYFRNEKRDVTFTRFLFEGLDAREAILHLYDNSENFKKVMIRGREFSLFSNWEYFVKKSKDKSWGKQGKIDRYGNERGGWIPSEKDLLHSRVKTTGMNTVSFQIDGVLFSMIDVGGQRSERRKAMKYFMGIDSVIFVGSMADYDESLYEDSSVNRLEETLSVFQQTLRKPEFEDTFFVLFLNKFDLFVEKYLDQKVPIGNIRGVLRTPPKVEDEDPEDPYECTKAQIWFRDIFMDCVPPNRRGHIKPFLTTALQEENNIRQVMDYCATYVISKIEGKPMM
eukprot:snap_masked-scaffold_57-processed-gene-1.33-mRNA-1 protein AED:0.28 eAED:0.28 QI:0/0/0/0.14/1/1/7/0/400